MSFMKSALLGSAAVLAVVASAQAADLPSKKAAPATYVKICDAKGAGFFVVPGTDTCMKIGGYVRVEYDYRGNETTGGTYSDPAITAATTTTTTPTPNGPGFTSTSTTTITGPGNGSHGLSTSGWYQRGVISVDARTPTAYGDVRAYIQTRIQAGSGTMNQTDASSLEAAYVQFAGFTFGQANQPYSFMSSWGYMSNWWTGWPNGVRQLSYTATLGGGLSATVSVQDGSGNASGMGLNSASEPQSWDRNGPIYIANARWDQSWGAAQVMGAFSTNQPAIDVASANLGGDAYAVGMGVKINLPMLGAGDTLELTANNWDGLVKLGVGNTNLSTPSSGSWGPVAPLASMNVVNSSGTAVGAQLQHYWNKNWRSVVMGSYAMIDNPVFDSAGSKKGTNDVTATGLGAMLIWSPVAQFDIGLHAQYVRWENKINFCSSTCPSTGFNKTAGKHSDDNLGLKLRVERRF